MTDEEMAKLSGGLTDDQIAAAEGPRQLPARGAPRKRYNMPAAPADDVELQPAPYPLETESQARERQAQPQVDVGGRLIQRDRPSKVNDAAIAAGDVADSALLGVPRKLYHLGLHAVSPDAEAQLASEEQRFHSVPIVGQLPSAAGYMLPQSVPSKIATGIYRGFGGLAQRAPGVVGKVLSSRPVVGAATGAASAAVTRGAENLVADRPLDEGVADSAAIAAGLGFGAGTVGAVGGKVARTLEKNPDRQLIERYGGKITPGSPAKGGAFDEPLIREGIDEHGNVTDAGIGKVARRASGEVRKSLNDEHAAARGLYQSEVSKRRAAGSLEGYHDFTDLAEEAKKMADDVERYTADTRGKVKTEILPILEKYESDGSYLGSAEEINRLRQKIQKVANFQTPTGVVKDKDLGRLAKMAKEIVDQTEFAEPNADYAARSGKLRKAHRALNIPGKSRTHTDPNDMASEKTLTDVITRRGQNTVTAGKYDTPELAEVIAERPELAVPMDSAALLRARARMQLTGKDKAGGLIERTQRGHSRAGRMIDEAREFVLRNATPIGQRFIHPLAKAADRAFMPTSPAAIAAGLGLGVPRLRRPEETRP